MAGYVDVPCLDVRTLLNEVTLLRPCEFTAHGSLSKCSHCRFCIRHGGGKSCRVPGCGVSARGSTGYCYKHRNLTSAISRKDSTASTASGSELDQASQLTPVGSAEEVSGGDVVDFSIDLASSYLDATCWEAQPATGECQTNLASLDFMALSDEKWTSFVEPLEPLPELLTNHINSDASDKLYLF